MPYRIPLVWICLLWCSTALLAQNKSKGKASYYSDKLHGRYMSSGIRYNKDSFTCAHRNHPFGTLLKVKNPANGKEVIVKVADRGPFSSRLIIDLSGAAARKLEIIRAGIALVEISIYQGTRIPFRFNDTEHIPELNLEIMPCAAFPLPKWKKDSAFIARLKKPHHHTHTLPKNKAKEKEKQNKPDK